MEAAKEAFEKWTSRYDPDSPLDPNLSPKEREKQKKAKQQVFDYLTTGVLPDTSEVDPVTWAQAMNGALLELNQIAAASLGPDNGSIFIEMLQEGHKAMLE